MLSRTLIILLLITTCLSSCTPDAMNNNGNGSNPGLMSADINGSLWYANNGYATSPNVSVLQLNGNYNSAAHIYISISGYTGTGSYSLGGFNSAIYYDGNGTDYPATTGNLTVTSDNGSQVMGIFSFSGTSTVGGLPIAVSSGHFNLSR
jgi:hypothetical protein